jgi:hypothetical protein
MCPSLLESGKAASPSANTIPKTIDTPLFGEANQGESPTPFTVHSYQTKRSKKPRTLIRASSALSVRWRCQKICLYTKLTLRILPHQTQSPFDQSAEQYEWEDYKETMQALLRQSLHSYTYCIATV